MWAKDIAMDDEQSKFNSGIAIVTRIDVIHRTLHDSRMSRNYTIYRDVLESFFIEMSRFTNEKEFEECSTLLERVNNDFRQIYNLSREGKPVPSSLRESFLWLELRMTRLEQKYNLGMPKAPDSTYALAR
jgi:hypothetical protein